MPAKYEFLFRFVQKLFLSAIVLLVIYGNGAMLFNHLPLKQKLPIPEITRFLFNIYSVFSSYQHFNKEYVVWGFTEDQQWIRLDLDEFIPDKRGNQHARMYARLHRSLGGKEGQRDAHRFLSKKIRSKYNRQHPDAPLSKIQFRLETWPRSKEGYEVLKKPHLLKERIFYKGP